ncbi:MAG: VOC family protein [Oligoflexales bacterium]
MASRRQLIKIVGGIIFGINPCLSYSLPSSKGSRVIEELYLPVIDMEKAIIFYKEMLGFPLEITDHSYIFHLGNAKLRLFEQKDLVNHSFCGPYDNHFALTCRHLEDVEKKLSRNNVAYGLNYLEELDRTQLFFRDPSGNLVEVIEEFEPQYLVISSRNFLRLHHVTRISDDCDLSYMFYKQSLGLKSKFRPPFRTRGYYLSAGGIEVHIIQLAEWMQHSGSISPKSIDEQAYTWAFDSALPLASRTKNIDPDGHHVMF